MTIINSARELDVYKLAYKASMEIFRLTKSYPSEEKYDLVSQIRRSSRSVTANIIEAWRRRRYPKNFVYKLNDSETEADETKYWLDVSFDCKYIDKETHDRLYDQYDHILAMLVKMITNPEKWKL
ncbi:MAG: four helix bundle protein [Bacteroidales bacterium]|jgi:four helix bundle protein|nr:four helix bundle protein [Bacteroidales bacterium]